MNDEVIKLLNRLEADFSAYIRGMDTLTEEIRSVKDKLDTLIAHSPLTKNKIKDAVSDATAEVVEVLRDDIKKVEKKVGGDS